MNTKEKIIYESLNLFSIKGFNAVSVRDIAAAVGIKASSLYNHFKNKQEIFDTIIEKYTSYINQITNSTRISNNENKLTLNNLINLSDEEFVEMHMKVFKFILKDEYTIKFRRILTIEQFNNLELSKTFRDIFINTILDMYTKNLNILMNENIIIKRNPHTLAIQLLSPVFLLYFKCEDMTDIDLEILKNHFLEFKNTYILKG